MSLYSKLRRTFLEDVLQTRDDGPRTFKMPIERNDTQQETDEREGSVNLVRGGRHCGSRMRCNGQERQEWVRSGLIACQRVEQGLIECIHGEL